MTKPFDQYLLESLRDKKMALEYLLESAASTEEQSFWLAILDVARANMDRMEEFKK